MTKVKIPKRVAGVKVPRKVRKQAKKALKLTESRAVRDLALAGLTLAAEAMLERGRAGAGAGRAGPGALDALDLGEVVHAAVAEGARRFLQGFEEGAAAASADAPAAKRPAAKKSAASAPAAKPATPRRKPKTAHPE
jgi:DNA end-binding protein Ku